MPTALERDIFKTVAYFAYFGYPLTAFEVWKWLLEPVSAASLADVHALLSTSPWLNERLSSARGFWTMQVEPMDDVRERADRFPDAMRKHRVLERFLRFARRMPFVEGIAVCNSLAFHHTTDKSDIDLFIVTSPGRIWTVRFLLTIPLMLLRWRPGERVQDPLCLSFFATRTSLDLSRVRLAEHDPYLAYWCASLMPVYDRSGWYRAFVQENAWVWEMLPHAPKYRMAPAFRLPTVTRFPWSFISERLARKAQEERFSPAIKAKKNQDTAVVVSDDMLKFHVDDRRAEIRDALYGRMEGV